MSGLKGHLARLERSVRVETAVCPRCANQGSPSMQVVYVGTGQPEQIPAGCPVCGSRPRNLVRIVIHRPESAQTPIASEPTANTKRIAAS